MLMVVSLTAEAQQVLSLDECRRQALESNRKLKQAEMKRQETSALETVALLQMFPKISANGGYVWTEKTVNLLSGEQKDRLSHIGDKVANDITSSLHDELDDIPLVGESIADRLGNVFNNSSFRTSLNEEGQYLVQSFETDTRQMGLITATVTQPIYLGGKLLAAYQTARLLDELSGVQYDQEREATLLAVDEAYWQVVSVKHKVGLAERYAALLDTLERNVQLAVDAETATQGDLAKVRVKKGEATMSLTKATNGLVLAKMLLAQRCGMPLDSDFDVETTLNTQNIQNTPNPQTIAMDDVWAKRPEMKMLRISDSIARQGVRTAASSLKPNIVATGGYMASNPNIFNGFSNTWGGTWMAGVVVNVPIVHPAGIFAIKAAKAKRRETAYRIQEAEEMIELQVNKLRSELELSYKKLAVAESNLAAAAENMRLADESFKAGVCGSSDLMAAQTAWVQAQGDVIDAQIEIEMGRLYLNQALGN